MCGQDRKRNYLLVSNLDIAGIHCHGGICLVPPAVLSLEQQPILRRFSVQIDQK